jgi:hypothetical protein
MPFAIAVSQKLLLRYFYHPSTRAKRTADKHAAV